MLKEGNFQGKNVTVFAIGQYYFMAYFGHYLSRFIIELNKYRVSLLHKTVTKHSLLKFCMLSIDLYGDHSQSFQTKNVTDTLTTTYPES